MLFWKSHWPCRNNVIVGELISCVHSSGICCRVDGWLVPDMSRKVLVTSPKIELSKKTLDISILEDNTNAFSRNAGHQSPVNKEPYSKRTETTLLEKPKIGEINVTKITTPHKTVSSRTQKLTQLYTRFLILLVIYCFVYQINYRMRNNFLCFHSVFHCNMFCSLHRTYPAGSCQK